MCMSQFGAGFLPQLGRFSAPELINGSPTSKCPSIQSWPSIAPASTNSFIPLFFTMTRHANPRTTGGGGNKTGQRHAKSDMPPSLPLGRRLPAAGYLQRGHNSSVSPSRAPSRQCPGGNVRRRNGSTPRPHRQRLERLANPCLAPSRPAPGRRS